MQAATHPTTDSYVLWCMKDLHPYDLSTVHRDMEKIFDNFDPSRSRQMAETHVRNFARGSKLVHAVGGRIANRATVIAGLSLIATLGCGVAAYMASRHSTEARFGSHHMAITAPIFAAKPRSLDLPPFIDRRWSKDDNTKRQVAPQLRRRRIDSRGCKNAAMTQHRVDDRESAAAKLRRVYAEDAAITRRLNKEALDTVVNAAAHSRRPTAPSASTISGDG